MNEVVLVGLASLYLWFLLAKASITEPLLGTARSHEGWVGELVNCGFCSGFWLTGGLLLATGTYDPVTHLATASVVGVVGGFIS